MDLMLRWWKKAERAIVNRAVILVRHTRGGPVVTLRCPPVHIAVYGEQGAPHVRPSKGKLSMLGHAVS